ncbi:hypothetical protein [Modicisalibacter zincidurans]|jgi:hypothetical protein|uniref:Uncharacterized protein n=1 Tax=Modicisalibacter zincidurans TaxID=1178777 RepID=A0ABP9RLC2_9GAMM|nr:hypothetical protein [Halomonas zincidurans]MEC8916999.1 hypothetical protein [Pseudomonadota bacterium]
MKQAEQGVVLQHLPVDEIHDPDIANVSKGLVAGIAGLPPIRTGSAAGLAGYQGGWS